MRRCLYLVLIILLSGCTTYNTATGRSEFIFVSTAEEVTMGRSLHRDLLRKVKLSKSEKQLERIQKIGERVAMVSDRQDYKYNFYLVEDKELNAFTTPGGNIYINKGLVLKLTSDDQIASVLAHEIGHCAARHTIKKFQAALGYSLIGSLLINQLESNASRQVAGMSSGALMKLVFSSYGRKDEYEADRLAVKYMHLAGYDVHAVVESLKVLESESKGHIMPLMLRSHPYLKDRIIAAKREIDSLN